MGGLRELERRYRGVWTAVVVAGAFFVLEVTMRARWLGFRLRDTLLSFEDNFLRWLVITLVVMMGVIINKRNREAAITRQILQSLRDEIANPLAVIYTQLEVLSIRAPGLRPQDLEKLASVQKAVIRIATLVNELSQAKEMPASLASPPAEPPAPSKPSGAA
jgi:signal transduction histidine kinase